MNIVLIGPRGCGKSAVAHELSALTGRIVMSSDAELERKAGATIAAFVDQYGWDAFRDFESEVIAEIATLDNIIIDTGGGAVLRQENVDALRARGRTFWLRAPVETLAQRIQHDTNRPSLTGAKSFVDEIAEVVAARTPIYAAAADHALDTEARSAAEVAREVLDLFEAHSGTA